MPARFPSLRTAALFCLTAQLLAGCGGGGSDSSGVQAPPSAGTDSVAARPAGGGNDAPAPAPVPAPAPANSDLLSNTCVPSATVGEALAKINEARSVARMCGTTSYAAAPPLQWNALLAHDASAHSEDMASQNYFSHTGLDGSTAGSRAQGAGYS